MTSKRQRKTPPEGEIATILLRGAAGVYDTEIQFNGERRVVMLDTGSHLTWFERSFGDDALRTDGMCDGDSYADGERSNGEFRYGDFCLVSNAPGATGSVTVHNAGGLLVASNQMRDSTGNGDKVGIVGLSLRQAPAWLCEGVPHPGDLITRILQQLPARVISLKIDREQAHSTSRAGSIGPSTMKFGGLHDDKSRYSWTQPVPESTSGWIVELPVSFVGRGGSSEPRNTRVLVDTGCTFFKLTSEMAGAMFEQWGLGSENDDLPRRDALEGLSVRFVVGGKNIDVAALDLFVHDTESEVVAYNRIRVDDRFDDFDMVFGMAVLAGLESAAFCYATRRVGCVQRAVGAA